MFDRSAHLYDAIYSWKDYADEVRRITELIEERHPEAKTLLDVACGTGKHLELLREHYEVEGFDLDPNLLRIAAERNPGIELHAGDMLSFDLGKAFDVVTCLFSSMATWRRLPTCGARPARLQTTWLRGACSSSSHSSRRASSGPETHGRCSWTSPISRSHGWTSRRCETEWGCSVSITS